VAVRSANEEASASVFFLINVGSGSAPHLLYTVPAGKELVVQYLGVVGGATGDTDLAAWVRVLPPSVLNDPVFDIQFALEQTTGGPLLIDDLTGPFPKNDSDNQTVHLVLKPGYHLFAFAVMIGGTPSPNDLGRFEVTMGGYLQPVS
jgi:hypothetical protein